MTLPRALAACLLAALLLVTGLVAGCEDDDYSSDAKLADMAVKG